MRFCVPIPCFFGGMELPLAIRRVRSLGFDAAEIYDWRSHDLDATRRACAESGVALLSMCTTEFRMTDPAWREAWLAGLRESCEAALRVGAGKLITQVGPDTGAPRQQQQDAIVETLKQATSILDRYGMTVMIEPLNTYVDHRGYYLWSSQEAFAIIRTVNHPLVKVAYDIYHQQVMEGNLIPNMVSNLDCIAHLHAAGHPGRHEPWEGETDYKVVFRAVDKAGYTGACGLEYNPLLDPSESLRRALAVYGA